VTPSQISALARHKLEILRLPAAEADALGQADGDRTSVAAPLPSTGVGCSITRDGRHEQDAGYDALPRDAGRLLLAWGAARRYPPLPISPGVSIGAGEQYWRGFADWAPRDVLALALERVQAASGRRCAILGCWSPRGGKDLFYCPEHRRRADSGLLWPADPAAQAAQIRHQTAAGAAQGRFGPTGGGVHRPNRRSGAACCG
jgi:hypothetical protein